MKHVYGHCSVKGKREENQDAVAAFSGDANAFFVVADGAGGLSHGKLGSQLVVEAVVSEFSSQMPAITGILIDKIQKKYRQINEYVVQYQMSAGLEMASTLSMLHFIENNYIVSNVGDTQVLLLRNGSWQVISQVHNLAWARYYAEEITLDQIQEQEGSHVLTKGIGVHEDIKPYIAYEKIQRNDLFILCTDGVYNHVTQKQMEELYQTLKMDSPIGANNMDNNELMNIFCEGLVNRAIEQGSSDNCSVVAVNVLEVN